MAKEVKKGMEAKEMLKAAASEKRKIMYNDRINLEILEDTKFFRKGQKISPHRVIGEQLIKEKTAKEI